jgi:peptidoglycan pentaglycine glycine transferase (the first glycine)
VTSVEWNQLVARFAPPFGAFLQSWEWGDFQTALGFQIERVAHEQRGHYVLAQAIRYPLPLGASYWHIPKGPIGDMSPTAALDVVVRGLPRAAFLSLEPAIKPRRGLMAKDRQPAVTTIIDLTQPSTTIADNMKAKTRYNIRLAQKKGVTARIVGLEVFEDFARLMQQTADRDQFSLHALERYKTMLEKLNSPDCKAFLAMAYYEDRPLAANLMIDAFGVRTYLHGASSNLYRNVMAPYALHDFLIQDAQAAGLQAYDFWGIAPPDAPEDHPWTGITRFKLGFGGQIVRMPGTFEVSQRRVLFNLYRLAKKLRG